MFAERCESALNGFAFEGDSGRRFVGILERDV